MQQVATSVRSDSFPMASRRGMALVVVLVVVSLLSLAALTFAQLMLAERQASELNGRRLQARCLAESGVAYVKMLLMQDETTLTELGGVYDNATQLAGMLVADDEDPLHSGRFTVISPNLVNGYYSGIRYGLEDESTKLNLNALAAIDADQDNGRDILLTLPGMTEEIADSILDWIDEDDDVREFGAESETYTGLDPAYEPKNGPLDSLDELLLVYGVTPSLLYGVDANRNNNADSTEPDSQSLIDVDNSDGAMSVGWAAYLTVHAYESTASSLEESETGTSRVDVNQDDLETLHSELSEALSADWAAFIVGCRQNGAYSGTDQGTRNIPENISFEGEGNNQINSILDLVGVKTQVTAGNENRQTVLAPMIEENSGSLGEDLLTLLDAVSVTSDMETLSGRININQASRTVLLTIPGMTEEAADQIIGSRIEDPDLATEDQDCPYWPLIQGLVDLDTMKSLEPYVCTGGAVYRAQIVGFFDGGGPSVRLEVLFDATQSPATVLFWNDISHLGRGYPLDMLVVE